MTSIFLVICAGWVKFYHIINESKNSLWYDRHNREFVVFSFQFNVGLVSGFYPNKSTGFNPETVRCLFHSQKSLTCRSVRQGVEFIADLSTFFMSVFDRFLWKMRYFPLVTVGNFRLKRFWLWRWLTVSFEMAISGKLWQRRVLLRGGAKTGRLHFRSIHLMLLLHFSSHKWHFNRMLLIKSELHLLKNNSSERKDV